MISRRACRMVMLAGVITTCAASLAARAQDSQIPTDAPAANNTQANVQMPHVINAPDPPYPPEARAKKLQGAVTLRAVIGADGILKDLTVVSGDSLLAASALETVRHWTFEPKRIDGNPVTQKFQSAFHLLY